jgi:two-component system, chemotaxis family, protein-glutamate methylesterase/glutaminase
MPQINVLIIDDSAVVRQVIAEILSKDRAIHVMAAVADPLFAMQRMRTQWPDVIVLDIEMPRMDGITFLQKIMAERATPVVICSSLTTQGAATTMQALAAGAVAVVAKPRIGVRTNLLDQSDSLLHAVRSAAHANVRNLRASTSAAAAVDSMIAAPVEEANGLKETSETIVAIGTSTGGTQALEAVLSALPAVAPGMVVVQHMPEQFTAAFARRLDTICRVEVQEARDGDRVLPGRVLIAPGGRHMTLRRSGALYYVEIKDGPPVHHHRPSVNVLFRSVAKAAGPNAVGIIMTGMGADGALGLKEMHDAGARTVAQDEASCVVFGMPKEAIKLGAVDRVLPLSSLAVEITRFAQGPQIASASRLGIAG